MRQLHARIIILLAALFTVGVFSTVQAKSAAKKRLSADKLHAQLLKRAKAYAQLFQDRNFKELYDFINTKYKKRVSRAMYEDYITFPDETDKYFLVTVEMCDLLDDITLGKVILKISTYGRDNVKGSDYHNDDSIGELESEFLETTDWVYEDSDWYKVERYEK